MGCCRGFIGKTWDKAVDIVTDPVGTVKEIGKTIDDIVIKPAVDIVEGSIDLSKNTLETVGKVTESVVKGDLSSAEDELKSGVNKIDNILSETYMDVRDPLEAAAVIGGNYLLPGSSLLTKQIVSEGAQDILNTTGGQVLNTAAGVTGGVQGNMSNYGEVGKTIGITPDANAVGGVTGPDNIDVGGGWSPSTGATAAELEAARASLNQPTELTDVDAALADLANSTPPEITSTPETVTTTPTAEQITSEIAADATTSEPLSGTDLGGRGASPNTMLGDSQYLDTVPAAVPSVSQITSDISGDNIDAGGGWSPATGATEAELSAARAAMASSGMTLSEALNYVRAGLLVNSITGDPLGLGGDGGGGGGGTTGFAQVPIPAEWKSPEYSYTPVQNVTFEDLFPGVSLQGTQWQGLQNAKPNMTFNDIFASGMQQTPMGSPVDINQIVSAIVGQNAKI